MKGTRNSCRTRWTFPILTLALAFAWSISASSAIVHYVDANGKSPLPPYTNWMTAATVIQDALDAASSGDTVLVTNGIYTMGGRFGRGAGLTNRVVLDKPVTLLSVNGP